MVLNITPDVTVIRDRSDGKVRSLSHLQKPYGNIGRNLELSAQSHPTPQALANEYVTEVAPLYDIKPEMLTGIGQHHMNLTSLAADQITGQEKLQIAEEKSVMDTTVVSYKQTINDLPIWNAGFSVVINDGRGVTSSSSSIHHDVKLHPPDPNAKFMPNKITPDVLRQILDLKDRKLEINGTTKLIVYQYNPNFRVDPQSKSIKSDRSFFMIPTLPLPPVPPEIKAGIHYVVSEVLFTLIGSRGKEINWRALIETQSGSVLYLRAAVACVTGMVYRIDPCTATGDLSITPDSPAEVLDPLRSITTLAGLNIQQSHLTGEFVYLTNVNPPDVELPTGNFSYSVPTDNFAAVNAYHHCDAAFRMVQEMGFDIGNYFDGTKFPVPVDHRSDFDDEGCPQGNCVNARANGNRTLTGSDGFEFALISPNSKIGIVIDRRIVLHEFGHALLWDTVHWPNFGFAHSAGDSLAAILSDPESKAPDRFLTFPWVTVIGDDRRHDRKVSDGWGWGGSKYAPFVIPPFPQEPIDPAGYLAEQILSTTLFRIYRALGGDSSSIDTRRRASRYVTYLIIRAIASLASDPITTTDIPDIFANALMTADVGTTNFEGYPRGLSYKVIRWSFEKQGLYQLPGSPMPVTTEGAPPDVDVFIDDGRKGEYDFQNNFSNTQDIWNRTSSDGGTTHQQPKYGKQNYAYVKVRNRGTHPANNVMVKGYHSKLANAYIYPNDWQPMADPQLTISKKIAPESEVTIGPFRWTPDAPGEGNILMIVSAEGDHSNADNVTGPVPNLELVSLDNNIAQKNIN